MPALETIRTRTDEVRRNIDAVKVDGKAGNDPGGLLPFHEKPAPVEVRS